MAVEAGEEEEEAASLNGAFTLHPEVGISCFQIKSDRGRLPLKSGKTEESHPTSPSKLDHDE